MFNEYDSNLCVFYHVLGQRLPNKRVQSTSRPVYLYNKYMTLTGGPEIKPMCSKANHFRNPTLVSNLHQTQSGNFYVDRIQPNIACGVWSPTVVQHDYYKTIWTFTTTMGVFR